MRFKGFARAVFLLIAVLAATAICAVIAPGRALAAAPAASDILYREDKGLDAFPRFSKKNNFKFFELAQNSGATITTNNGVPWKIKTNNTVDNWIVKYSLDLTGLSEADQKGDLWIQVAFDVRNAKRYGAGIDSFAEDDIALFRLWANDNIPMATINGDVDTRIKADSTFSDITTDWIPLQYIQNVDLEFTTIRGEDNDNVVYFSNIRVYIHDSTGPKALKVSNGSSYKSYYTGGESIDFQVEFDEPVKIDGTPSSMTVIGAKTENINESVTMTAQCLGVNATDGKRIDYRLTVPEGVELQGVHISEQSLNKTGGAFDNVTDNAGNAYLGPRVDGSTGFNQGFLPYFKMDSIAPSVEKVEIIKDNPNKSYFGAGHKIYFDVTFSEDLNVDASQLQFLKLELNNGVVLNGDTTWPDAGHDKVRFTYTIAEGENSGRIDVKTTDQGDGTWNMALTDLAAPTQNTIKDRAGNFTTTVKSPIIGVENGIAYVCSQRVRVDTTPPTISVVLPPADSVLKRHTFEVQVTDNDGGAGVSGYTFTVGTPYKARVRTGEATDEEIPMGDINSGPSEIEHYLDIETNRRGQHLITLIARDGTGNTRRYSFLRIFDPTPPSINISYVSYSSDSAILEFGAADVDNNLDEVAYQWATYDNTGEEWVLDPAGWETPVNFSADTAKAYTSGNIEMPVIPGEINFRKLYVKAMDTNGNVRQIAGSPIYFDLREPCFDLQLPEDASEIRPDFDITVAGAVYPATDVWVQWVKDGSQPLRQYTLSTDLPGTVGSTDTQKYFNNSKPFNGIWLLNIRAKRADNSGDYIYLDNPIPFKFDNQAPMVDIASVDNTPAAAVGPIEVTVKDYQIRVGDPGYEDGPFYEPDYSSPDSHYWLTDPSGTKVLDIPLPETDPLEHKFTVNLSDYVYGTGMYTLTVTAMGHDGIPTTGPWNKKTEFYYLDVDAPRDGTIENLPRYVNTANVTGVKFTAQDITGAVEYSLVYNYAVGGAWQYDIGDSSGWPDCGSPVSFVPVAGSTNANDYFYRTGAVNLSIPDLEGEHTVSWVFADSAGNYSEEFTETIILDKTPPSGGLGFDNTLPTNQNINVVLDWTTDNYTSYEDMQTFNQGSSTWAAADQWSYTVTQNGTVTCTIRDLAGNEAAITGEVTWIDKQKPVIDTEIDRAPPITNTDLAQFDVSAYDQTPAGGKDPVKLFYQYDWHSADQEWHPFAECDTPSLKITRTQDAEGLDVWTFRTSFQYTASLSDNGIFDRWVNVKAVDAVGNETISSYTSSNPLPSPEWHYLNLPPQIALQSFSPARKYGTSVGPVVLKLYFKQDVVAALDDEILAPTLFNEYGDSATDDGSSTPFWGGSGFDIPIHENGTYDLTYADRFGNTYTLYDYIAVDWIDNAMLPEVTHSPEGMTNGEVTVTIDATGRNGVYLYNVALPAGSSVTATEGAKTVNIGGSPVTAYKKVLCQAGSNGKINYSVYSEETGQYEATYTVVDTIDTGAPAAEIAYTSDAPVDDDGLTRGNITASVVNVTDNSGASQVTCVNTGGSTHIFTDNGTFDFILEDGAGNRTVLTAEVTNIDRTPPVADITPPGFELRYFVNMPGGSIDVRRTDGTYKITGYDVHVQIIPQDESSVTAETLTPITENDPVTCDDEAMEYVFTEDAVIGIRLTDAAGNTTDANINVNNIDKLPPQGTVTYSQDNLTHDVEALLTASDDKTPVGSLNYFNSDDLQFNGTGQAYYVFTDNGSYTFVVADEAGNMARFPADVRWIDRVAPTFTLSPADPAGLAPISSDVNVFITPSEPYADAGFVGTRPEGVDLTLGVERIKLTFSKNATVAMRVYDKIGNSSDLMVTVNCIDKEVPTANSQVDYDVPAFGYATIKLINTSETVSLEQQNGTVTSALQQVVDQNGSYDLVIRDEAGNRATVSVEVSGIDAEPPQLQANYTPEGWTRGPVTVSLTADEDIVLNEKGREVAVPAGTSYDVVMDRNGAHTFYAKDAKGNTSYVTARVYQIDDIAPVISFSGPAKPVFIQGQTITLDDCTAADNVDGDISAGMNINYNGLDVSDPQNNPPQPGKYIVQYSVTDNVGNQTTTERDVTVLSPDDFRVFVNDQDVLQGPVLVNTADIDLCLINLKGGVTVKWKRGYYSVGEMKHGGSSISDSDLTTDSTGRHALFTVAKTGWYTVLVREQERQTCLVHIYVSGLDN